MVPYSTLLSAFYPKKTNTIKGRGAATAEAAKHAEAVAKAEEELLKYASGDFSEKRRAKPSRTKRQKTKPRRRRIAKRKRPTRPQAGAAGVLIVYHFTSQARTTAKDEAEAAVPEGRGRQGRKAGATDIRIQQAHFTSNQ